MSKYTFILNPTAGKGAGQKLRNRIHSSIRSRASNFELIETSGPGNATLIARTVTSDVVVAVGGDGTINEVVNGIIGSRKILGVIPIGSGNDFIKNIGVPKNVERAFDCIFAQHVTPIDVARVTIQKANAASIRNFAASYFVNGCGAGFDAMVAERTRKITWTSGTLLYIVAVLQTLGRYNAPEFVVDVDGRRTNSRRLLIAIGNGVCAGGGFYLTPGARIDDGVLDVCLIDDISTMKILKLMPQIMKGSHRTVPSVHFEKGKIITIASGTGFSAHADGEFLGSGIEELRVELIPKALNVISRL